MSSFVGAVPRGSDDQRPTAAAALFAPSNAGAYTRSTPVDYETIQTLRRTHPGWRLLAATQAPLVVTFLHESFLRPNVRAIREADLIAKLEDLLFHLREQHGPDELPRSASEYLHLWADDDHGWLRRYYPAEDDEAWLDVTPAAEKAIEWLISLRERQFVGTESRLRTVLDLLRQLVMGTELDAGVRIAELEKRRAEIDAEIARLRGGDVPVMDDVQVKDRFQQMESTARGLLADFREVEQNFRSLDRTVRERIATWEGGKGELLNEIFGEHDAIGDSDQGKTFRAFWDFVMSPTTQDELTGMLRTVLDLPPVQALEPDQRLLRIHYDWLEAGDVAQRTVARVSEQLRRYLDDQAWLENRRILRVIRNIEQHALALREEAPSGTIIELDEPAPDIELPLERPLFSPARRVPLEGGAVEEGVEDAPTDALFSQVHVDRAKLVANVRRALRGRSQVGLDEVVAACPIELGVAEVVTYLAIAADDENAHIDDSDHLKLTWHDPELGRRQATVPRVVFTRGATSR